MLILQNISYIHPNKDLLLSNIQLTVHRHQKLSLIGNNGAGKSTLLRLIAGELHPAGGKIICDATPYYVPQVFGQYDHLTVAQALKVDVKLRALGEILDGIATQENQDLLADDWTIEERCSEALGHWGLSHVSPQQEMSTLSGGQKIRVFLAGIAIHQPELILLDEPGNHLDSEGRSLLTELIRTSPAAMIIVSHDKKLLAIPGATCELSRNGIAVYGGSYDLYAEQKQVEHQALKQDIQDKEKALRKAREKERETIERRQKSDSRGKGKQEKAGTARIMMNQLRNDAENSTSRMKGVHEEKIGGISQDLRELRAALPDIDKMKFDFESSALHKGKILFTADSAAFSYGLENTWRSPLSFHIVSGERIALKGPNGSGKTTLVRMILGALEPTSGTVRRSESNTVYIDQDYSLIDNSLSVYGQALRFNTAALQEHEVKTRLSRFLFAKEDWDKSCGALSGGERMRLALCCMTLASQAPDIIVLDEPTNNLDIRNTAILTAAVNEYRGTLIIISHDESFLEETGIERFIELY